ncbi:hypothetical protein WMY93_005988 [Mugilogobius chulae]|uniref:Uncharacterized protein n=1 Tax=Mugilogobius chulae TaxID=88201 RepID=A0AAW0PPT7_9GOBI
MTPKASPGGLCSSSSSPGSPHPALHLLILLLTSSIPSILSRGSSDLDWEVKVHTLELAKLLMDSTLTAVDFSIATDRWDSKLASYFEIFKKRWTNQNAKSNAVFHLGVGAGDKNTYREIRWNRIGECPRSFEMFRFGAEDILTARDVHCHSGTAEGQERFGLLSKDGRPRVLPPPPPPRSHGSDQGVASSKLQQDNMEAVALFFYAAAQPDELSFNKGI